MAQGLQLSDFKRTNYKLIVGVLILVLAVIFLPDILNMSGDSFKTASESVTDNVSELVANQIPDVDDHEEEVAAVKETDNSELTEAELVELSRNGYVDRLADYKVAKQLGEIPEGKDPKPQDLMFPPTITWKELKNSKTIKILNEARIQSLKISEQIPVEKQRSRFALYNYANGIQSVLAAKESGDVREVLKYLESLDLDVSKSLAEDAVGRNVLMAWSKISIAEVLGNGRTDRMKSTIVPGFAPEINLSAINMEYSPAVQGQAHLGSGYQVSFSLSFASQEIKNITVYRNSRLIKTYNYGHVKQQRPMLEEFQVQHQNGSGIYTVVVSDKFGYQFVKNYRFIPKNVKKLPWKYDSNSRKFILKYEAASESSRAKLDSFFSLGGDSVDGGGNVFLPPNSSKYLAF